jgi:hypothetical protein
MLEEIFNAYPDDRFRLADGFDAAIIGVSCDCNCSPRLVYSVSKVFEILMEVEKMTYEEALEHFEFNIAGSYFDDNVPVWCYDNF